MNKLKNYLKYNLNNVFNPSSRISHGDFYELMIDVVTGHYRADELMGDGVDYFFISNCSINPRNRKFNVARVDGSTSDFSYHKALSSTPKKNELEVKKAFRMAVDPFVKDFKRRFFEKNKDSRGYVLCEVTGLKIKISGCHTDHKYPYTFDSLFYRYIKDYNIDVNQVKLIEDPADNRPILADEDLISSFYSWHEDNARLRCIYWRANLQDKRTKNFNGIEPLIVSTS